MSAQDMKCRSCGSSTFVQATDYINLRPVNRRMSVGSEKIYTVCLKCGEVHSIKINNLDALK